jgi:predicted enzyme related to lactoylglutathione lyase
MRCPVHFGIHATDAQRAMNFYSTVFGWKLQEYMPNFYWMISTGKDGEAGAVGLDGGLNYRPRTLHTCAFCGRVERAHGMIRGAVRRYG